MIDAECSPRSPASTNPKNIAADIQPTTHCEAMDQLVAVLQTNSESTDAEIYELINHWLSRRSIDIKSPWMKLPANESN